ncbi:MAG: hypothetical protein ACK5P5_09320 [Pseudobdellovibrionaceae bacterium]
MAILYLEIPSEDFLTESTIFNIEPTPVPSVIALQFRVLWLPMPVNGCAVNLIDERTVTKMNTITLNSMHKKKIKEYAKTKSFALGRSPSLRRLLNGFRAMSAAQKAMTIIPGATKSNRQVFSLQNGTCGNWGQNFKNQYRKHSSQW